MDFRTFDPCHEKARIPETDALIDPAKDVGARGFQQLAPLADAQVRGSRDTKKAEASYNSGQFGASIAQPILRLKLSHIRCLRTFGAFLLRKAHPVAFAQ